MSKTQLESSVILTSLVNSVARRNASNLTDSASYYDDDDRYHGHSTTLFTTHHHDDGDDYIDLLGFLTYLLNRNKRPGKNLLPIIGQFLNVSINGSLVPGGNRSLLTAATSTTLGDTTLSEDPVKVGLLQFLILVLVFLFFFFICKCNHMLESCRNRLDSSKPRSSSPNELEYHDKKSLKHYCCFFWYEFKMRRRFKKRRRRNRRFNGRNTASSSAQRRRGNKGNAPGNVSFDRDRTIRRTNSILKRRSMMTRNRIYSTVKFSGSVSSTHHPTAPVVGQAEPVAGGEEAAAESAVSVKETTTVKLVNETSEPEPSTTPTFHTGNAPAAESSNVDEIL